MNADIMSKIIEGSIGSANLYELKDQKCGSAKDLFMAIFKLVSKDYTGAVESALQSIKDYIDYKDSEFIRKYSRYIYGIVDTTPEQRHMFLEEVHEKAEDFSGNVIMGIVDRMDNIHKEEVLAKLTVAKINGWISIEEFFRLSSLLERIPYVDLKMLPYYQRPFYDESGDTELLYATGALNQYSINANGPSLYVLSTLGEKLLSFGLGIQMDVMRETGTNIDIDYATPEDAALAASELT